MSEFNYRRYLASREWAVLKEAVRERCEGRCEFCDAALYQETHHVSYERIGNEELDDLLGVCSACHRWLSAKTQRSPLDRAYLITEQLQRAVGVPLHFVWQRLAKEDYSEAWAGGQMYWAHCRVEPAIGKCKYCTASMLSVEDFYFAMRTAQGWI